MQLNTLTHKQQQFLAKHYRLALHKSSGKSTVTSEDLLLPSEVNHYITQLTALYNSPSNLVTASQFSKKYAFLMVAPFFASITLFNCLIDLTPTNCSIQPDDKKGIMVPALYLKDLSVRPLGTNRKEEIHNGLKDLFLSHLSPVWEMLTKTASVPPPILWENTATYIYWLYETSFYHQKEYASSDSILEDFNFILEAPADCFGVSENPFTKYYNPKQQLIQKDPPVRIRKTCCFYYELSTDRTFCKTCPRCLSGYIPRPSKCSTE